MKSCPSCQAETDDQARFCLECGYAFEAAAVEPADPWQGRMVAGRFRIVRKLGDGGMGEVFLAEQVPMGRSVAVKVLRQSLSDDPEQVARFKREAQAASQLQHPNTIIVHDFGQDADGTLFIAMEYLEGHPLDAVLEEQGTLEPERAARIMTQVCASLNEAHARGMVHRDLKPENIFLVDRGTPDFVKVLDFGIAKVTQSSKGEKLESITRAGAVFGTPHYMAPEQIRGEELDARADVYALGVILYRMIAGHLPFEASTVMEMLTKHLTAEPAPIQRDGGRGEPAARARLEAVALRALCKQPDQRQPSALAFVEDIMAALPGITFNSVTGLTPLAAGVGAPDIALPPPVVDAAPPQAGSGSNKGLLIAFLALLLAGGAAAAWWFMGQNGGGPDGAGGTPAVLGQGTDEGGDEGGGNEATGDEKPAAGDEKPADGQAAAGDEKPADGEEKPADGEGAGGEAAATEGAGGDAIAAGDEPGDEAEDGAAGEKIDEAEAQRITAEAAKAEAEATKEKAAADAERVRIAAEEKAKAVAAEKQAAEAVKAKAESDKAEAEAARAKAEAEKAAAEEAAAEAKAKEIQATAGRKQAEAAAALARANRLKAEAAAARAKAEAGRMRVEMARLEVAKVNAEQARAEAEAAREAAEAKALEAETRRAEAAEQREAAKKGRRAAAFGTVKVITQTRGAKVKINGSAAAVTPTGPIKLRPGRHVIEVIKDGKRVSKTITVSSGKQSRVSFSL